VIDELGQGGMGTVYVGVDDTLDRKVALKVIRAEHRLDPVRKARFLREARILSKLDHPGICQLHDYIEGEADDCLVLELVEGDSLRTVIDDSRLSYPDKLDLAARILDVLAAVHAEGVIHRDLTPLNVMMTPSGGVKVLDFGLARRAEAETAEDILSGEHESVESSPADESGSEGSGLRSSGSTEAQLTTHGTVMGTAGYLSPEQARGQAATAASDMYSLGLILQELFTGESPYGENLRPRELLRRSAWAETREMVGFPADLTALVRRLTSLIPASRPTAVDAARMLQNIIDGPRRRRRRMVVAAVWLILAAFSAGMTIQFLRAEREAGRAEQHARLAEEEATAAREVSDFLVGLFEVSDPAKDIAELTARELLENGAKTIDIDLAGQPVAQSRMLHTMGMAHHHMGDLDRALEMLERALELRRTELGPDHPEVADTLHELCLVHRYLGDFEAARRCATEAVGILESTYGPDAIECVRAYHQIAVLDDSEGDVDAAEAGYLRCRRILEAQPDTAVFAEQMSDVLQSLASVHTTRGDFADAEPLLRRAVELEEEAFGRDSIQTTGTLGDLGASLIRLERYEEAEPILHRVHEITMARLGASHPFVAGCLNDLAHLHYRQKHYPEAASYLRQALDVYLTAYGPEHPHTAIAQQNLGMVLIRQRELDDASALIEDSLRIRRKLFGEKHPDTAYALSGLALARERQGRFDEAVELYHRSLAIREELLGESSGLVATTLMELAVCLRKAGREDEAAPYEERARSIRERQQAD
jgi:tetratricopeptide (TPR) repeat protein/tRNA A-37 threonylcarbamoyl transferase component Bud32